MIAGRYYYGKHAEVGFVNLKFGAVDESFESRIGCHTEEYDFFRWKTGRGGESTGITSEIIDGSFASLACQAVKCCSSCYNTMFQEWCEYGCIGIFNYKIL